jgi:tetrahydromethanopterin S-methyltransferase subunit B
MAELRADRHLGPDEMRRWIVNKLFFSTIVGVMIWALLMLLLAVIHLAN